jgi:hypothetical protein
MCDRVTASSAVRRGDGNRRYHDAGTGLTATIATLARGASSNQVSMTKERHALRLPVPWRKLIGSSPPRARTRLWVADLSYLRCWEGLVFFAFVIDAFSRRVVGWQLSTNMRTTLVLDALRMVLGQRGPGADVALVHHSDRGVQGGFNRSLQRLLEGGCDGSDGAGVGACGAAGDGFAGAAADWSVGASSAVVGGDRPWRVERGRGGAGRSVGSGRRPVVSRGLRYAVGHAGPASGRYLSLAERERDRGPARGWGWRAGDLASAGSCAVDDLAGAAA